MKAPRPPSRAPTCLAAVALATLTVGAGLPGSEEVRALWVTRASLTTQASISSMVDQAQAHGFNTLLVQVRARGDAFYADSIEPRAQALAGQAEAFDPLAAVLTLAHRRDLRVHAWVNVNLVSSAVDISTEPTHIVRRHPEWLMVPRAIGREMLLIDPASQLYVDKLARHLRSASDDVEGLYLSPIPVRAADHTVGVVADLALRYPVDGVHFDYARYPSDEFDYSRAALDEFDAYLKQRPAVQPDTALSARGVTTLLANVDADPERWREFRQARLTSLMTRLRQAVKSRRPDAIVSAAVVPDVEDAVVHRLQDWPTWLARGLVDVVCPMAYATDPATFMSQIADARRVAGEHPLWAGIGAYRLSSTQTAENIRVARRLGANGIALFSYDSVTGSGAAAEYLAAVARAAFNQ